MTENSGHWQARPRTEDITAIACPECGAGANEWCDRSGDKLTSRGMALLKAGTPPSHQLRMWSRQGHEVREFPSLLAKQRPGMWDESAPRSGKSARRPAVSVPVGCAPCQREREFRAAANLPGFPAGFPCRHPAPAAPSSLPRRYQAERPCSECQRAGPVEVGVQAPNVVGYRCGSGHKWLAAA